jgi:hypothetical protein
LSFVEELSVQELIVQRDLTSALYESIQKILKQKEAVADVSYRVCEEVIIHHRRDIERLYAVHHRLVHPTKHCSYLAFWIRKLKPIANAFPASKIKAGRHPPLESEDTHINEKVCIFVALQTLFDYIDDGILPIPPTTTKAKFLKRYSQAMSGYFTSEVDNEMTVGDRFSAIVYDMRFRTFGPHHLTHLLTHILREVAA